MARMKVTVESENFGTQKTVWNVDDEMEKAYTVFLVAWMAKGFVVASQAVAQNPSDTHGLAVLNEA